MSVFPNPANTSTKVVFEFQKSVDVTFFVYDIRGIKVKQLPLGKMNIGEIELDNSNLLPGIYFIKIVAGEEKLTERIVIE